METVHLARAFKKLGVPFTAGESRGDSMGISTSGDKRSPFVLSIGIDSDKKAQVNLLNVDVGEKALLMQIKSDGMKDTFLCGLDEYDKTFIARITSGGVTNVKSAKAALKPAPVQLAETSCKLRKKNRNKRHNEAWKRQGEWFFIPEPDFAPGNRFIRKNAPLGRAGSRPHMAAEAVDFSTETVYVYRGSVLREADYAQLQKDNPVKAGRYLPRSRSSVLYVRGKVTAPDHATLNLQGWHRAEPNREAPRAGGNAFLGFWD